MAGKILVLGATGTVGRPLVAALLAKGEAVKAASRGGAAIGAAEGVAFDLTRPELFAGALAGVDRIYVCSPTGIVDAAGLLRPFLEAAIGTGAKIVVHTAIGVEASDAIPLRQVELQIEGSGVPYVILRPNWFMDNFASYWLAAIQRDGVFSVPAGEARTSFIAASDIALAAAAALTSDRFDGQALVLTGDEALNYGEAAALLSQATGREIAYVPGDEAALVAYLTGQGVTPDYAQLLVAIFQPVAAGWCAAVTPDFRALTGQRAKRLADYVAENAAVWR